MRAESTIRDDDTAMTPALHLSRLHWPVTVLGPGRRVGIWLQGCTIHCPGCCSRDTWAQTAEHVVPVASVIDWVLQQPQEQVEGFTISGGEPFDQPNALLELLVGLRAMPQEEEERDILIYSGHPWRRLEERHGDLLRLADAVISEPYVADRPTGGWAGSSNQMLHLLTPLAQARFDGWKPATGRSVQAHFDGHTLWMIGIPAPGSLDELRQRLLASGVGLDDCSWLA